MTPGFVLVHSPLVGPATWSALAAELARRGIACAAPDLDGDERDPEALWRQHARGAARALTQFGDGEIVLVGHSGTGALLPAIRDEARVSVAGYVFVDAGLPGDGPRQGTGEFARSLAALHVKGRRYPDWTDEMLRELVPDEARRQALLAEVRPQPPRFWDEDVPVIAGWPDAPCAYLRFTPNPAYDAAAAEARQRGWPYREIAGGHFHMLVDEAAVADALVALAKEMA